MYLTPKKKPILIERLNEKKREGEFYGQSKEIMKLCQELNTYDGVCVVDFSAGRLEVGYSASSVMPGQGFLWLWLEKKMFDLFHQNAFELLEKEPIRKVNVIYDPYQPDESKACIMQISFAGQHMEHFDDSLDAIRWFISSLYAQLAVKGENVDIARYLTPEDKEKVLQEFDYVKEYKSFLLDEEIVPFCDKINKFEGVCTVFSCVGHEQWCTEGLMMEWGYLDLWLDKRMFDLFRYYAFELINPPIERLEIHYQTSMYAELDKETCIIKISFQGKPMNALDESMNIILKFIHSLVKNSTIKGGHNDCL